MQSTIFGNPIIFFIFLIWITFWKGLALWKAARQEQRNWFIAMLVISTPGILEIVYLFFFARKRLTFTEIKGWIKK